MQCHSPLPVKHHAEHSDCGSSRNARLTWVVDAAAAGGVEGSVAEVGAARGANEHALREYWAKHHHCHNRRREVHCLRRREDDSSIDGSKDDAPADIQTHTMLSIL